jgi:hypothetical protein
MARAKINSKGAIGNKKKHEEGNNARVEYKEHKLIVIANN